MPHRLDRRRRWLTALSWPTGVVLTSWDYMWRTTPLHRRELIAKRTDGRELPPAYPDRVDAADVQPAEHGHGPLFHRRYRTSVRRSRMNATELMAAVQRDLNSAAPTKLASFQKVRGDRAMMAIGDEYVVRMPGPWDGPVRVIDVGPSSFRLATLQGHLEAGQIEFRARDDDGVVFEIESWARSSDFWSNLLYQHLRMAKEVQLHMWLSFLENVTRIAGGRLTGGVDIETHRIEDFDVAS